MESNTEWPWSVLELDALIATLLPPAAVLGEPLALSATGSHVLQDSHGRGRVFLKLENKILCIYLYLA